MAERQILDNNVPVDFYIYQAVPVFQYSIWITSETDFVVKNQKHGETTINTLTYNTGINPATGPAFTIQKVLTIKVTYCVCFSLLMESETKMWLHVMEVGGGGTWGPNAQG